KEEGISFNDLMSGLKSNNGKGFLSTAITNLLGGYSNIKGVVEAVKSGKSVSDAMKSVKGVTLKKSAFTKEAVADKETEKTKETDKTIEIEKVDSVSENDAVQQEAAAGGDVEFTTTGEVASRSVGLVKELNAKENPENNPINTIVVGAKAMEQVFKEIDKNSDNGMRVLFTQESQKEEATTASEEETAFNEAKTAVTKITGKMNLSDKDKKAISEAKNMDELKAAVSDIEVKGKGVIFKSLLMAVINKEENKGKGFMAKVVKAVTLAQAKGEIFKSIDGKGFKGTIARLMASLGLFGLALTPKERAMIAKAGSIQELKAIAKKFSNMKGLFGKTIGKAIAAKLNAIIAKAEGASGKSEYPEETINAIMNQTGVSREDAIAYLDKAKEDAKKVDAEKGLPEGTTFNQEMALLNDFLAKGGSILNCASSALFTDLGGAVSEGLLALQALSIELGSGNLTSESVQGGQLHTSENAINEVLKAHGKESAGYNIGINDLANSMNPGDTAILHVDGDHYVTVTKNADGTLSVTDPNKNNGKPLTYSSEEFTKLISGGTAKTTDGQSVAGYTKVADGNGQVKVVTDSKGVAKQGTQQSVTDMKNTRGASIFSRFGKWVSKTVDGAVKAVKSVVKGIVTLAKSIYHGVIDIVVGAAKLVWGVLKTIGGFFYGLFTGDWKVMKSGFKSLVAGLGQLFTGIGKIVAGVVVCVINSFSAMLYSVGLDKTANQLNKWADKSYNKIVAVCAIVVAVALIVVLSLTGVGTALAGALFPAMTGLAATLMATGITMAVVGAGIAAAGVAMKEVGKNTGQKWLEKTGQIMTKAGLIIGAIGIAVAASAFIAGPLAAVGNFIWSATGASAISGALGGGVVGTIVGGVVATTVVSTALFAVGQGIRLVGVWTDSDLLKKIGTAIGGAPGNYKFSIIPFVVEVGWEDGHFGYGVGVGMTFGNAGFIGYQKFRSFAKVDMPDGSRGYFTKTKAGVDLDVGGWGASCLWSTDNIYGKCWKIGAKATFPPGGGATVGLYVNYQEKDAYGNHTDGWSVSGSVGFTTGSTYVGLSTSYNTKYQTLSVNASISTGIQKDGTQSPNALSLSFGGSYSFKNGDWSTNVSAGTKWGQVGFNHSVLTDEYGNRSVTNGMSVNLTYNKRDPGPAAGKYQLRDMASINIGYSKTKVYDKHGNFLQDSDNWSASASINFDNIMAYGNIKGLSDTLSKSLGFQTGLLSSIFGIKENSALGKIFNGVQETDKDGNPVFIQDKNGNSIPKMTGGVKQVGWSQALQSGINTAFANYQAKREYKLDKEHSTEAKQIYISKKGNGRIEIDHGDTGNLSATMYGKDGGFLRTINLQGNTA
ncbi:MAG: hypothetical protein FWC57_04495, partial [Endomicrobia bacterium]|nr:hypothetical protein [Endomicrobiia bacterium]